MITKIRPDKLVPTLRHQPQCLHDWRTFKETIKIDNPDFNHIHNPYFVVRGCINCHTKRVIDYVMN